MSIVILGASGNLGSQLQVVCKNDLIAAWDRSDFDFLNFLELKKHLDVIGPSIIINAAAYNAVDNCEKDDQENALALLLNRDLPAFLADYCLEASLTLVHYSTDYVFGGDNRSHQAYIELDKANPVNRYGESKLAGEKEIARRALQGLNYYLIRTSKLFGPRGFNELSKPSFFEVMLDISKKKDSLQVVDGELSCFTYTPDLAKASLSLLEDKASRGIYHLINSGPATWYQGADYLFKKMNIDIKLQAIKSEDWPRPARRPDFSVLANIRRRPLRSWQEALNDYIKIIGK